MTTEKFLRRVPPPPGYVEPPENFTDITLVEHFQRVCERFPDKAALIEDEQEITYGALGERVEHLASGISQLLAGERQQRIIVFMPKSINAIASILAIMRAGQVMVVLDTHSLSDRTTRILEHSDPALILTDRESIELLITFNLKGVHSISVEDLLDQEIIPKHIDLPSRNDLVGIYYTSGSTGRPKAAAHTHFAFSLSAMTWNANHTTLPSENILLLLSLSFSGAHRPLFAALAIGNTIVLYDVAVKGFSELPKLLDRHQISNFHSAATTFRQFLLSLPPGRRFESFRSVRTGGEKVLPGDFELFNQHFGPDTYFGVGGGTTEALWMVEAFFRNGDSLGDSEVPWGYLIPPGKVEIWDGEGRILPDGELGEIVAHNPCIADGYWQEPDLDNERFIVDPKQPGWRYYRTGDAGYKVGDLLFHRGRLDFMVKVRGFRVELGEVEAGMLSVEGVLQAAVVAKPNPQTTNSLHAFVVLRDGSRFTATSLRTELRNVLPAFMIPASITFLSEMPLNHAGKLNRDALIVPDEDARAVLDSVYREPQTALEAQLINIWETVLQVSPIGVDDKFLDLGGDSLSAARVFVEIETLLGGSLPPGVLYEHETIFALAKVISVDPDLEDLQVLRLRKGSPGEAPLILISPFGGDPWLYAKLIEHLPESWPIYGLHSWKHRDQKHMYADTRQVARDYLGAVRKMQADGALRFCGYSFGGVIALEMAQQLYQNEGICEPVALLDTIGPGLWPWHLYRPWTFTYRLAFGHFELTRWQHIMGGIRNLRQIFFVVFRWIEKSWVDLISRKNPKYFPIINNPLFRRYVPKVYPGKGLNVVTSQSKDHFRTETLAWKDYFESGYEEFHIESTHRNFLKEEHSETVAEKLRDLYSSN